MRKAADLIIVAGLASGLVLSMISPSTEADPGDECKLTIETEVYHDGTTCDIVRDGSSISPGIPLWAYVGDEVSYYLNDHEEESIRTWYATGMATGDEYCEHYWRFDGYLWNGAPVSSAEELLSSVLIEGENRADALWTYIGPGTPGVDGYDELRRGSGSVPWTAVGIIGLLAVFLSAAVAVHGRCSGDKTL